MVGRKGKRNLAIGVCLLLIAAAADDALLFHGKLASSQAGAAFAQMARAGGRHIPLAQQVRGKSKLAAQHHERSPIGGLVFARPPLGGSSGDHLAASFAFSDDLSLNGQDLAALDGGNPGNFGPTGGLGSPNGNGLPLGGGGTDNGGGDGTIFLPQDGSGALTPTVPEPSTWGLMILGFGGVAAAMRRQVMRLKVLRRKMSQAGADRPPA